MLVCRSGRSRSKPYTAYSRNGRGQMTKRSQRRPEVTKDGGTGQGWMFQAYDASAYGCDGTGAADDNYSCWMNRQPFSTYQSGWGFWIYSRLSQKRGTQSSWFCTLSQSCRPLCEDFSASRNEQRATIHPAEHPTTCALTEQNVREIISSAVSCRSNFRSTDHIAIIGLSC